MKPDSVGTLNEGYAMAQNVCSITNKIQLKYTINNFVRNIKDKRLPDNEKVEIVNYMCDSNNMLMRFFIMCRAINHDEMRRNILRILNDNSKSEENMSLAEIVENNEIGYLQILASFISTIYAAIN